MKKAVIFDLNGVLIVGPLLSERIHAERGVMPEDFMPVLNEVMAKVRLPGASSMHSYWLPHFKRWGIKMTERQFEDFWFTAEVQSEEMVTLCREIKSKGARLFVLSNNLRERSAYYDKHFPFLKELFEKEYYSWKTGYIKPDVRCYELILEENNLKSADCVYFDDSAGNVAVAQSLGIESYVYQSLAQVRQILGL